MSYKSYDAYLSLVKSTPEEFYKEYYQDIVDVDFEDSSTIKTVIHNDKSVVVRAVGKFNSESLSRNNEDYQKLIFKDSSYTVSIGDMFIIDNNDWLCTDVSSSPYIKACSVQKCKNSFTMYYNHMLIKVPYVNFSNITSISMGTDESKYLEIPDNNMMILTSNNLYTNQINRNDIYQLYNKYGVIDNYKVIDINRTKLEGLIIFKLEWTAESPITHQYTISILNGSDLQLALSQSLTLNVEVKDNGTVIPTSSLTFSSSNTTVATISSSGAVTLNALGTTTLTVALSNDSSIKAMLNLTVVSDVTHNYSYSIVGSGKPDTEIEVNDSQNYVATKYDNGIAISQTFTFTVVGDITAYKLTIIDGNHCKLDALKSGKTIVLRATDDSDSSKYVEKNIKLISLF